MEMGSREKVILRKITDRPFVGCSESFAVLKQSIRKIAPRKTTITILGETGTGKEMVARQIHHYSERSNKPFIPVDCTTLTGQLFESQLFGHKKGAFTGAGSDTIGFFRAADGGTIFLDEIGELDADLQSKLLRVIQESCVVPVGSTEPHHVDVRVLCATNRDLKEMVRKKTFRADLYFRLNIVQLAIPPLRERKEDIIPLAEHFIRQHAALYEEPVKTLSEQTKKILLKYNWPGNVRELANIIEQSYVMTDAAVIDLESLPASIFADHYDVTPAASAGVKTMDQAKREAVVSALKAAKGRRTIAASKLQINYRQLMRLIDRYAIKL